MIAALRTSNRDELIALTRRHLEPSPEAYIRAYQRRFGDVRPDDVPVLGHDAAMTAPAGQILNSIENSCHIVVTV